MDVPTRLFRTGSYPEVGIPLADEAYLDALVANSNTDEVPIEIEHSNSDAAFDMGHIVPGSFERRGDEVWGVWRRHEGDEKRLKVHGLSVRINRPTRRFTKVAVTVAPRIPTAQALFSEADGEPQVWLEGDDIVGNEVQEKPKAETPTADLRGLEAKFAESERARQAEADQHVAQMKQRDEVIDALKLRLDASEANFARSQASARAERERAAGVPSRVADLLAPLAEGLAEARFSAEDGEEQVLTAAEVADEALKALRGAVKFSAELPHSDEREEASFSSRLDAAIAKHTAAGKTDAEAADLALIELGVHDG